MLTFGAGVANITRVVADVLGVAANTDLDFEGAAGRALREQCGARAEEIFASRRGKVKVGDVVITPAVNHPHASRIAWAVVRDYSDVKSIDDSQKLMHAVAPMFRAAWSSGVPPRGRRLSMAVIPIGSADVGVPASIRAMYGGMALALAAMREEERANIDVNVLFCAHTAENAAAVRAALQAAAIARPIAGARGPSWAPSAELNEGEYFKPPAAARTLASFKKESSARARIEHLDGCHGGGPTGCRGITLRVTASDRKEPLRLVVRPPGAITDVALNGVRVTGDTLDVVPGRYVLSFLATGAPTRLGLKDERGDPHHLARTDVVYSTSAADGWRGRDFDDGAWASAVEAGDLVSAPDGAACRWRFSIDYDGNPT